MVIDLDPARVRSRMRSLRRVVQRHDVYAWAREFLSALQRPAGVPCGPGAVVARDTVDR
jgi:trehalose-6-phosphate synthase